MNQQGGDGEYFFAFDVETAPDVEAGRRLYGLEGLSDPDAAKAMAQLRLQESGHDFLRLYLHRVVAISGVLRRRPRPFRLPPPAGDGGERAPRHAHDRIQVWSLGDAQSSEKDLIDSFFRLVDSRTPTLVTWNGGGFDLPLLVYRALHHGVETGVFFETRDHDFRFNNYRNRYHERHTDLMDVFAAHQPRAAAPLDEFARFLGLPGKEGMRGAEVADRYFAGDVEAVRRYCETDALLTWLIYLRFDRIRGRLDGGGLEYELELVREAVAGHEHLQAFAEVRGPS